MKFQNSLAGLIAAAMLIGAYLTVPARAMPALDSGGQLIGATNVDVGGNFFDFQFLDGSCFELFSDCDDAANDFDFPGASAAAEAAQELLDQVFSEGSIFDSDPTLIRGCESSAICIVLVPAMLPLGTSGAQNAVILPGLNNNFISNTGIDPTQDTTPTQFNNITYARVGNPFPTSPPPMPEPTTLSIFGAGIAAIALARRRFGSKRNLAT